MSVPKSPGKSTFLTGWLYFVAAWLILASGQLEAQDSPWRGGSSFSYRRQVEVPPLEKQAGVVVTEFFTNGELHQEGSNLAVFDRSGMVPWRVLQTGPGDFCRVAFQTSPRQSSYQIYFGGDTPPKGDRPAWTVTHGLVLETRHWKDCDLNQLDSVRQAFSTSDPAGCDIVPNVFHRANPFASAPGPFLSRYSGKLEVTKPGRHKFFTSSQDASFLLIDGKEVVAAPGRHGAVAQARVVGEVELSAGPHDFEYLHAAAGDEACMVAAWQPPGPNKPDLIPGDSFGFLNVLHLPATHLQHRAQGTLPDFSAESVGEVPLADSDELLVRVQFTDAAVKAVTMGAKIKWEFGDGQTDSAASPEHIYLRPGVYTVTLSVQRGAKTLSTANRVAVRRPLIPENTKQKPDQLVDYLPVLEGYAPAKLSGPDVVQLVRAYEQAGKFREAASAGQAVLRSNPTELDDTVLHSLVRLVGPLLRGRLDDSAGALEVWQKAEASLRNRELKAECLIEAAEICLSELLQSGPGKTLLDRATPLLEGVDNPALAGRLHRLQGDWRAEQGEGDAALKAYREAEQAVNTRRDTAERNAHRGAYSRSIEAFLRTNELDRARDELQNWMNEFPADQIDGYRPLLEARYRQASLKFPQAIRVVQNLLTVNPNSPYADQLAFLGAECEEKLGNTDRAVARYQLVVKTYPGSPLVDAARQALARLEKPDKPGN